jgi:hypothetical protein
MASPSDPTRRPEAESRFFRAWAAAALRLRWLVLLTCVGTTLFLTHQMLTALLVDNSNEAFMEAGSEADRRLKALRDAFGRDEVFLVLVEGDVFSLDYLRRLRALHEDLREIDLTLPSLGQRKADRDRERGRLGAATDDGAREAEASGDMDADFDEASSKTSEISAARTRAGVTKPAAA